MKQSPETSLTATFQSLEDRVGVQIWSHSRLAELRDIRRLLRTACSNGSSTGRRQQALRLGKLLGTLGSISHSSPKFRLCCCKGKSLTSETASRIDVSRAGHAATATLLARRLSPSPGSITADIDQVSLIFLSGVAEGETGS